jgi:nitrite reductase/ring-hydroxylating ferredoxin subunit
VAYRSLEKLINLHDGYRRTFRVDGGEVLLLQENGERWLIERHCPHAGQALDNAAVEGATIRCPRHGYCFSLDHGQALEAPCGALGIHSLVYEGNSIGVDEDER